MIIKNQDPPAIRSPSREHLKFMSEAEKAPADNYLARRAVLELQYGGQMGTDFFEEEEGGDEDDVERQVMLVEGLRLVVGQLRAEMPDAVGIKPKEAVRRLKLMETYAHVADKSSRAEVRSVLQSIINDEDEADE